MSLFPRIFFQKIFGTNRSLQERTLERALSGNAPAPEIEIERTKPNRDAVVLVSPTEPAKDAACKEENQGDSPNPNQDQEGGGLHVSLNHPKRL